MINAKVKMFNEDYPFSLEKEVNEFLATIDVRQIIKTEYSSSMSVGQYDIMKKSFSAVIYYVEMADVRDAKIDNVLEIK
jgi:hypothetical protein